MLGREAVVDRHDEHLGEGAELATQHVVGVQISDDEAAAVEVEDGRQTLGRGGARVVAAHGQCARPSGNRPVEHIGDRRWVDVVDPPVQHPLARLGR